MVWHTLKESMVLTGRSRRSLYRDMATGTVSYRVDVSGHRQLETSELMRAYGSLVPVAHTGTVDVAQVGTPETMPPWELVLDELQALRKEVRELRSTLMLIEHKPEQPDKPQKDPSAPATWAGLLDSLAD
jgi:hypothetical protein